ncbi:peroxiredoxin [Polymorphobacter sp.]|uniref:peroxiredoxin n=1 Tax=Polymorphobacter sp. TaxID=1909290 RepID=UPI003F6F2068
MTTELKAGDPAPDFTLETDDAGTLRLADFAGRKLLLYFYPKDDTPGCTNEAKGFSALLDDFAAADTAIIGVSRDSLAAHAKFRAKYGLRLPLGADDSGKVTEDYGVWVSKSMYGKTYMGIERASFLIGRDGCIASVWRKVKVPGHAEAVLEAARAI